MARYLALFVMVLGCLLTPTTPVSAEEPKGFQEWSWGTPKATLMHEVIDKFCRTSNQTMDDEPLTCLHYSVGDVIIEPLLLKFTPDGSLSGYSLSFKTDAYARMGSTATDKFGPATSVSKQSYRLRSGTETLGDVVTWRWPGGTTAALHEICGRVGNSCLIVSSKALNDFKHKEEAEERARRKGGF
jgi:hypothetical protein